MDNKIPNDVLERENKEQKKQTNKVAKKEARTRDPSYVERNPTPNEKIMGKKELWCIVVSFRSGVAEE